MEILLIIFTAVIAGATVVYAISTKKLWKETRDHVQLTQEQLKLTRLSSEMAKDSFRFTLLTHYPT